MMRMLVVVLALAGAACTPEAEDEDAVAGSTLPAPTPDDVAVRIAAGQAGETINVGVNQRFAVELIGVPTAGYQWIPAQVPDFLTRAGEAGGNTTPDQNEPGFAGGNHWEILMFAATAPGTGELVLEQRRPWETEEAPADSFRVTIVAE
jgi:inhibitor of cysteine peptidase